MYSKNLERVIWSAWLNRKTKLSQTRTSFPLKPWNASDLCYWTLFPLSGGYTLFSLLGCLSPLFPLRRSLQNYPTHDAMENNEVTKDDVNKQLLQSNDYCCLVNGCDESNWWWTVLYCPGTTITLGGRNGVFSSSWNTKCVPWEGRA